MEAAVPAPRERAERRSELFSPPDGLPTAEKPLLDGEFTAEGGFLEFKKKKKKKRQAVIRSLSCFRVVRCRGSLSPAGSCDRSGARPVSVPMTLIAVSDPANRWAFLMTFALRERAHSPHKTRFSLLGGSPIFE